MSTYWRPVKEQARGLYYLQSHMTRREHCVKTWSKAFFTLVPWLDPIRQVVSTKVRKAIQPAFPRQNQLEICYLRTSRNNSSNWKIYYFLEIQKESNLIWRVFSSTTKYTSNFDFLSRFIGLKKFFSRQLISASLTVVLDSLLSTYMGQVTTSQGIFKDFFQFTKYVIQNCK